MPTPRGEVRVGYRRRGDGLEAEVSLPEGLTGILLWKGRAHDLRPGTQRLDLAPAMGPVAH
jgi:hypothetical protein